MNCTRYDVLVEPRGDVLVEAYTSSVSMVVRDGLGLNAAGKHLLNRLHPHLAEQRRSRSWPGTSLLRGEATVLRYQLTAEVLEALLHASPGLYGWKQPDLPEDLAFLRGDGSVLLASISHEGDAILSVSDQEYDGLASRVTGLRGMLAVSGP